MKTLDQLDHEEARQALALFSQMEAAAKGRDVDAILAASLEDATRGSPIGLASDASIQISSLGPEGTSHRGLLLDWNLHTRNPAAR